MNILITGANGILGQALVKMMPACHTAAAFDIEDFDITDYAKSLETIEKNKPGVIIHCAAFTNVDGCETEQDTAYLVNSTGTKNIALTCQKLDIPMVYISTDYVFDGTKGQPYLETDKTNPIGVYGKTKFAGEQFVGQLLSKFYIVRTSWLFGPGGKNFVDTIIKLAGEKDELRIVHDQIGCPTYAPHLARAILQLIETPRYGIYHITNQGTCSWYEFAKAILETAGIKVKKITPVTTAEFPRPAPRPAYSVLENHNLKANGFDLLPSYKEALREYLMK